MGSYLDKNYSWLSVHEQAQDSIPIIPAQMPLCLITVFSRLTNWTLAHLSILSISSIQLQAFVSWVILLEGVRDLSSAGTFSWSFGPVCTPRSPSLQAYLLFQSAGSLVEIMFSQSICLCAHYFERQKGASADFISTWIKHGHVGVCKGSVLGLCIRGYLCICFFLFFIAWLSSLPPSQFNPHFKIFLLPRFLQMAHVPAFFLFV